MISSKGSKADDPPSEPQGCLLQLTSEFAGAPGTAQSSRVGSKGTSQTWSHSGPGTALTHAVPKPRTLAPHRDASPHRQFCMLVMQPARPLRAFRLRPVRLLEPLALS